MSRASISKLVRATSQSLRQGNSATAPRLLSLRQTCIQAPRTLSVPSIRTFFSTPISSKGLSPESENPQPTPKEPTAGAPKVAPISDQEYNTLSNEYMDLIVEKLEQLQEDKASVDVEYSVRLPPLHPPAQAHSNWRAVVWSAHVEIPPSRDLRYQ